MDGFVELDQKQRKFRWTDGAEGIAVGCSGQGRISAKENSELNSVRFYGYIKARGAYIICRLIYHTGMSRMQTDIWNTDLITEMKNEWP